jgi:hypothetical protein
LKGSGWCVTMSTTATSILSWANCRCWSFAEDSYTFKSIWHLTYVNCYNLIQ